MLILVAVTVNLANENGGLFEKARYAKSETAVKAEEEELTMYMFGEGVYNAKTGEVNLGALKNKLDEDSNKWKNSTLDSDTNPTKLTVIGVQSGEEHIINTDGTMGEKVSIVGTYHGLLSYDTSSNLTLTLNSDNTASITNHNNVSATGTYSYNQDTKSGEINLNNGDEWAGTGTFDAIIVNNNIVLEFLNFGPSDDLIIFSKNYHEGLNGLGRSIYINGNKTMEFSTYVEDGITKGIWALKTDGVVLNSEEGDYIFYNGKIIAGYNEIGTVSDDLSTITWNGETYTKQ